jgi:rubrerythrin
MKGMNNMADAWDRFMDGTREAFNTVADVAEDLFDKGKGYVNDKRAEQRLKECYRDLGRLQYRIEMGDPADEDEKKRLVDAIKALLEELRGNGDDGGKHAFFVCNNCGHMVKEGDTFCSNCGQKV